MSGRRADSVSRAAAEASHLVLRTEIVSPEKHGSVRPFRCATVRVVDASLRQLVTSGHYTGLV